MMKHLNKTLSAFTGRFVWQEIHNYPPPEPEQPPLLLDPLTQILGTEGNEGKQAKPETKEKPPSSTREYLHAIYTMDNDFVDEISPTLRSNIAKIDKALFGFKETPPVAKAASIAYMFRSDFESLHWSLAYLKNARADSKRDAKKLKMVEDVFLPDIVSKARNMENILTMINIYN